MKTIKSMFNLIEITMAIAVVGIGIAGIMALFPPAIEANHAANINNYINGISESLATFIENDIGRDWTKVSNLPSPPGEVLPIGGVDAWTAIPNFSGLYGVDTSKGIYGIKSTDGSVCAHVRIWQNGAAVPDYNLPAAVPPDAVGDTAFTTGLGNNSRRIFAEVSWPVVASPEHREKRLLVFEVFKY